jgi:hypothetical protein
MRRRLARLRGIHARTVALARFFDKYAQTETQRIRARILFARVRKLESILITD